MKSIAHLLDDLTLRHLCDLAERLRAQNPELTFVVDNFGVWLRTGGHDYGMYAVADGTTIVDVYDGKKSFVHRDAPA